MSSKFDVGTLEEDFKQIGLLPNVEETTEVDEATSPTTPAATGSGGDVQAGQKSVDAKGKGSNVQAGTKAPEAKGSDKKPKTIPVTPDAPAGQTDTTAPGTTAVGKDAVDASEDAEDDVEENSDETDETDEDSEETDEGTEETPVAEGVKLLKKRRLNGKERVVRRKQKMLRRRNKSKLKMKAKKWRKSSRGKRFLKKYKQVMGRMHGHAPKGKRVSLKTGMDRISNLIEDVKEIVTGIENDSKQETVKSFANIALIANKLAESYAYACENFEVEDENDEELDLCGGAEHFEALATEAARLADGLNTAIQEGTEFEGTAEEVSEMFSAMLTDVLEGLDLFSEMSEDETAEAADGEVAEGEDSETAEDSEGEEATEGEDEDEDDDAEEAADGDDDDADDDSDDSDDSDDDEKDSKKGGEKKEARPTK